MEIIIELNHVKYLIIEILLNSQINQDKFKARLKRHGVICQGIKEIRSSEFFDSGYSVVIILVPEKNVVAFNNDED